MTAPININASRESPPISISLKDRVVRSLSLRRNHRGKTATPDKDKDKDKDLVGNVLSSSPPIAAIPEHTRHSTDNRQPQSSGVRSFGFGSSFGGSNNKPPSPLAQASYTSNPFENLTTTSSSSNNNKSAHVNFSPSSHDLTGAHQKLSSSSGGSTGAPASRSLAVPISTTSNALSSSPTANSKKRPSHSHSQSHSNISLLSRSLSRSRYLGGSGNKERKVEQKEESQLADDSYVVLPPSASSRSPLHTNGGRGSTDHLTGKAVKPSRSRSPTRQQKNAYSYDYDRDRDTESLIAQRPLLRSRSFDSLVPSLLSDYGPNTRILVQSTKRAEPLERLSAPPTKNVFSIQRMPWGDEDEAGRTDGEIGDDHLEREILDEGEVGGWDPKVGRERAQTADGRLGLLRTTLAGGGNGASGGVATFPQQQPHFDLVEELSSPVMRRTSSSSSTSTASTNTLHRQGSLAPSSPARSPANSPGMNATRLMGTSPSSSTAGRSLREHWTRELEGKTGPFIVVERGWKKGIYTSSDEAARQTRDFPGPKFQTVDTAASAIDIIAAHQPVTPSATTAEGLLARSGSLRKMNVASSYGAAGARASRFLGLDVAESTAEEEGVGGGDALSGRQPAVPPLPDKESRKGGNRGQGGLSYAARRAARLRMEAEAKEGATTGGGGGVGDAMLENVLEEDGRHRGGGSNGAGHKRDGSGGHHQSQQIRSQEYGRSSMDSNTARVLFSHDSNRQERERERERERDVYQLPPPPRRVNRDRTRSGGFSTLLTSSPSTSRRSGGGGGGGREELKKRPSTANRAAELEYGLLANPDRERLGRGGGSRRERVVDNDDRGRNGEGADGPAPKFGYAYASALGASVTVQRAHTISGAR
ncbi:hypothetical protein CF319_g3829 [Tilletia indica]|nr:hypothetical protein CF319_g3829 [Tilletia indica]